MSYSSKSYTPSEIEEIVKLREKGLTFKEISQKLGRTPGAINVMYSRYTLYKQGRRDMPQMVRDVFARLLATPRNGPPAPPQPVQNTVQKQVDHEKNLENALMAFQEAVVEFIDIETKKRTEFEIARKEQEISALKEKYELELKKMQTILVEAQNSSVVGMLRKKWSNGT